MTTKENVKLEMQRLSYKNTLTSILMLLNVYFDTTDLNDYNKKEYGYLESIKDAIVEVLNV